MKIFNFYNIKIFDNYKVKTIHLFSLIFMLFIPIDMINGILLRSGYPSLSAAYKSIVLIFLCIYLLKHQKQLYIFGIFLITSLFLFIHTFILKDVDLALSSIDMLFKFIAIIIFYLFFLELLKQQQIEYLFFIAWISFLFLAFNIFLGALGFGYGMYGGNSESAIGTKGFIFAGNELGAAVIISGAIVMIKTLEDNYYLRFFILGLLMLILSALMASKVSMLGVILLFFMFPLLKAFKNLNNFKLPKKDFYYSNIMFIMVPLLSIIGVYYALYESNLISRLSFFYEKMDLITLIFSNRNIWALEALEAFKNYEPIELLFGTGRDWWQYISENKIVEIDPLDFLMTYGIMGFLFIFGTIFFILYKAIKNRRNNPYSIYIIFILLLLLAMSLTAGHILNSGTAGFLIAITMALANYNERRKII
jgi:hypothetical protein